jgi:2-haloacid dehalogenase
MPTTITAIIFDFGGVLIDWDPRNIYHRYFPGPPQAVEDFLSEINFAQWNLQQDKGRPFAEAVASLSADFPQYAHLIRAYWEHWEESILGPIAGSIRILKQLKQAGYPLYGLSNWSAETFPIAYKKYDFFKLFDGIILSGEVKLIKPDPAIFNLTLQRIRRSASECLLIDDSITNIEAARRLGFKTIHFQSPDQLETELSNLQLLKSPQWQEQYK